MRLRELVKSHPWMSAVAAIVPVLMAVVGYYELPAGLASLGDGLWWLVSSRTGKAIATGVSILVFVGYWVVMPAMVARGKRSAVADLCQRLDALAVECEASSGEEWIQFAVSAGSVVGRLREVRAFAADIALEEQLDLAARGQLLVQMEIAASHPHMPQAQPQYQMFWLARKAAFRRDGVIEDVATDRTNVASGCRRISAECRK